MRPMMQQQFIPQNLEEVNLPNPAGYGTGFGGWLTSPDVSQGLIGAGSAILAPNSGYGGNIGNAFSGFNEGMQASKQRRIENAFKAGSTYAALGRAAGTSGGGTMGALATKLQQENPGLSFEQALDLAKSRLVNQGVNFNGQVAQPLAGFNPTVAATEAAKAGAKQNAQNASDVNYNAEKSRQTELGKNQTGVVSGGEQATGLIDELRTKYKDLDKAGGIVNTDNSAIKNIGARLGASYIGQAAGKAIGTEEQSIRNSIATKKPLLLSSIKSATGMSSQQLNSNVELQFYAAAATDPTLDVKTNKEALDTLDNFIKTGSIPYKPELHAQQPNTVPSTKTSGVGQIGGKSSIPKSKIVTPGVTSYQDYFKAPAQ